MPIYIHIYGHTLFVMYMCMGLLSILCTSDQQKRHKLRRGPSNWHNIPTKFGSNSNWLVVPEKKIKMLKFMDETIDTKWWQYLTWTFGSNDLTMVAMVTIPVIWVCVSIMNIQKPNCKILFENTENYIKIRQELTSG
jgi:hypothetical protein